MREHRRGHRVRLRRQQRYEVHPGAWTRSAADGLDNDCNGLDNERDAIGCKDFYYDEDGDTYGISGSKQCWCDTGKSPWTGKNTNDCYDKNANARPGQANYFKVDRGDGKYDFNCDRAEERRWRGRATSCAWKFAPFSCKLNGEGWVSTEPRCGGSADYRPDCDGEYDVLCIVLCAYSDPTKCPHCWSCEPDDESRTQACR